MRARNGRTRRHGRRGGFSLMEAVVSVGMTAALMGGIVSVMSIASTAAYNNSEATEDTYQARDFHASHTEHSNPIPKPH